MVSIPRPRAAAGPLLVALESDATLRRGLRALLRGQGYRVALAASVNAAVAEVRSRNPDVVLVALGSTDADADGAEVVRSIREWTQAPLLVCASSEAEQLAALEAGADDYLTKPFGARELLLRLRLSLRRVANAAVASREGRFSTGDLSVDLRTRRVSMGGAAVRLTPIEYKILAVLVAHAGTVVTGRSLLSQVWGPQYVTQDRYLRVYMVHLRRKIEPNPRAPVYVLTEPGIGYRLNVEDAS